MEYVAQCIQVLQKIWQIANAFGGVEFVSDTQRLSSVRLIRACLKVIEGYLPDGQIANKPLQMMTKYGSEVIFWSVYLTEATLNGLGRHNWQLTDEFLSYLDLMMVRGDFDLKKLTVNAVCGKTERGEYVP